jgi:hypothetical protein
MSASSHFHYGADKSVLLEIYSHYQDLESTFPCIEIYILCCAPLSHTMNISETIIKFDLSLM